MKVSNLAFTLFLAALALFVSEAAFAKEVVQALRDTENKTSQIMMVLGPLSIAISAGVLQVSRQLGTTMLIGSCIGTVLFAGRRGIFDLLFGLFG